MSTSLTTPMPASRSAPIMLFGIAVVATICWLAINAGFPELRVAGIFSTVTRLTITATILGGLWFGLARTQFDRSKRMTTGLVFTVAFLAWQAVVWSAAVAGSFRLQPGAIPMLPIAIILPLVIGLPVLMRSQRVAAILDAMPPYWVIGLQVYRIFGSIFLLAYASGNLAGLFGLPAGTGDTLVGLLALPTAYLLYLAPRENHSRAVAWNFLGILDLVIAISIGFLTAPGPFQLIVPSTPNTLLGTYPTVMTPAFMVPTSLMLHALSLRQLARRRKQTMLQGSAA
jgi:hypothetical protein